MIEKKEHIVLFENGKDFDNDVESDFLEKRPRMKGVQEENHE